MDPFTNLPFGICAIYFDLDSRSSGIVKSYRNSQSMYFFVVETDRQLLPRFCDYYSAVYKNCQGSMASQIQHPPHCCLSNIHFYPYWNTRKSYNIHLNLASCCQPFFSAPQQTTHTHQHLNPWCRAAQTRGIRFGIRANWRADRRWQLDKLKWFHSKEVRKQYETMICFFWMFNTKVRVPNNYWGGI